MNEVPVHSAIAVAMGKRVRRRRKELKLTQEQAAECCGLSAQFFACLERGIKNIRAESAIKIACGLNISADYLLFGKMGEPEKEGFLASLQAMDAIQCGFIETVVQSYVFACECRGENGFGP